MYKSTIILTILATIQTLSFKRPTTTDTFLPSDEELLKSCIGNIATDDLIERDQLNNLKSDLQEGRGLKCKKPKGKFAGQLASGTLLQDEDDIDSQLVILPGESPDDVMLVIKGEKDSLAKDRSGITEIDLERYRHSEDSKLDDSDDDSDDEGEGEDNTDGHGAKGDDHSSHAHSGKKTNEYLERNPIIDLTDNQHANKDLSGALDSKKLD